MEGDATGLDNLAGLGMLDTDSAIYYAGTLANQPAQLKTLASQGAQLVLTDTNRKQAFRWDTLTANSGYTETPSDNPAKTDLSDSPIELFPGTGITTKSYASYAGAVNVTASSYGNSVSYTPEDQAYSAIDNNLDTAWITGTFVPDPKGQWWQSQFADPVTTDHITLVQPQRGDRARWVSKVTLTFDGKDPVTYALDSSSHAASGQTLTFPSRTFHTLRVTIDGTTDDTATPVAASAVGFSEVEIPGQQVKQVIQMPTQMLTSLGAASAADRLSVVMTRVRTSQYPPRSDPETTISRQFTLPTARTFTLSGSASLSALIPDDEVDRLVGRATTAVQHGPGRLLVGPAAGGPPGDRIGHTRREPGDLLAARTGQRGPGGLHADLRPGQAADADHAEDAGDRRRAPLGPDGHDDHLRQPDARRDAAADRRRHGAGGGHHRAGHLPRAHRLALRRDVHRRPAGVRGELLLCRLRSSCRWASRRSASPACWRTRRRPRSPATACRTC